MPGLGDGPSAIVQPRTSDLIGLPSVEPRSTDRLAEAFRTGFITADDVIGRVDKRAQLKKKADIQAYEEQLSPEAVEAREAIREAEKFAAKEKIQKAEMEIADKPFAKRIRRLEAARRIAENESFGTIDDIAKQFTLLGIEMPLKKDAETGAVVPDLDRARDVHQEATRYMQFMQRAKERRDQIKMGTVKTGNITERNWLDDGGLASPMQAGKLRNDLGHVLRLDFDQWKAMGAPYDINQLPGQNQSASSATPPVASASPSPAPGAAPAPAPAGETSSAFSGAGAVGPTGGIITESPDTQGEPGTEVQVRAKGALARFGQSNDMISSLEAEGFDPASVWTWMGSMMPELLKPENNKAWEAAREAWAQGILRYESGAAITAHEQKWYSESFFPKVRDPQWVIKEKAKLRSDMERVVAEVANSGGAATPTTLEMAKNVTDRAAQIAGWSGEKGTQNPENLGFEKKYTPQGHVRWRDPDTGITYEPDIPAGGSESAAPTDAVTTPPKPSPPTEPSALVQPRPHPGYIGRPEPAPSPNPFLETAADLLFPPRRIKQMIDDNQGSATSATKTPKSLK